jgi:diacylglycerol kinase (ATP)
MPDSSRPVLVISNSASGGSDPDALAFVERELAGLGPVSLLAPHSVDTFDREIAAAAAESDVVVVAGGDGTFNRTLNALRDRLADVSLGLVPMGTGNDFARTLALPRDARGAARVLVQETEREVDVWRARSFGVDRLFINACMGGFPVEVNEAIDEDLKRRFGPLAFWVGGAKAASDLTRYDVTMGGRSVPDCVAAGVGNGRTCGGGIRMWPEADPGDGLLDACALHADSVADALKLAATVKSGGHVGLDGVATFRGERIEVTSEPPIAFNIDGELVGLESPVVFERAGIVRVRAPQPA